MNVETLREAFLALPDVTEDTPFDDVTLAFRVGGKIFGLMGLDNPPPPSVNLKCDPARAEELRERYAAVQPGFHMNKTHWNTVTVDGSLPEALVRELIAHSYALVRASLTKKQKAEWGLQ